MTFILNLLMMYLRAHTSWPLPDRPEPGPVDGADVFESDQVNIEHSGSKIQHYGEEHDPDVPHVPVIAPATAPKNGSRYLWIINAGHGAIQTGKRSPILEETGERFLEYRWNRRVKDLVCNELARLGIDFVDLVPEVNVDDFLVERVHRANELAKERPCIYVSIHANAGPAADLDTWQDTAHGTETWHYYGSRRGRAIAAVFQRFLVAATGFRNRHLRSKRTSQFYELRRTVMPSILTESGFYNHPKEVRQLMDPEMIEAIAFAHVDAIIEVEEKAL